MKLHNRRRTTLWFLLAAVAALAAVTVAGLLLEEQAMVTDFSRKDLTPSLTYLFGTDWLGRDMFCRTLAGLSLSIRIGLLTAAVSALVALVLGVASATLGGRVDAVISWCIDLVMGIPHILLVMLISIAFGKGFTGVVAGVALSHWTSLARVIRGEVLQLRQAPYILAAGKLGVSRLQVVRKHMLPHLLPQYVPHILHIVGIAAATAIKLGPAFLTIRFIINRCCRKIRFFCKIERIIMQVPHFPLFLPDKLMAGVYISIRGHRYILIATAATAQTFNCTRALVDFH